jgi:hypothetical protein
MPQEVDVTDNLRLLLKAVRLELLPGGDHVSIPAKRVPHEGKVQLAVLLRLENVRHLMNEEALPIERLGGEIWRPERPIRREIDVAVRSHGDVAGLEGPPAAADDPYRRWVDGIAEDGVGKGDLAFGERPGLRRHCRFNRPNDSAARSWSRARSGVPA